MSDNSSRETQTDRIRSYYRIEAEYVRLNPQLAAEADVLLEQTSRDPAVVALSGHALWVLQRS